MSFTYESAIGYNDAITTYDGDGQELSRTPFSSALALALRKSNARLVFLATANVGQLLEGGLIAGGGGSGSSAFIARSYSGLYQPENITEVRTRNGETLTQVYTGAALLANRGSWMYQSTGETIDINPPENQSDTIETTYHALQPIRFSNHPKYLRDVFWEPRIENVPNLSFRIDAVFGGVGQLGGGSLTLNNGDGFFDTLNNIIWDSGKIVLECGVDGADGSEMDEADFMVIGTWRVEETTIEESTFTIRLREIKNRMDQDIPFEVYTRDEFPNLDNEDVGKTIPIAYGKVFGAEPIVIDRGLKKFKVAGHKIRSFDDVRIQTSFDEVLDKTVSNWTLDNGATNRYFAYETLDVSNVQFDGDDLEDVNSIAAVESTAGSWYREGNVLYVRPPSGEGIADGVWTVSTKQKLTVWQSTNFESVDLSKGEFTLGDDWDRAASVSVDFSGRVMPDGQLMTNGADIAADLVDYVGEIQLDSESFVASRAALHVGYDRHGNEINQLAPSIYINDKRSALDVVAELNATVGAYTFVDFEGRWRFNVFTPMQVSTLAPASDANWRYFTETEIEAGTFKRSINNRDVFGRIQLEYAYRMTDEWGQSEIATRESNRHLHDIPEVDLETREVGLSNRQDVIYQAQRILTTEAEPLTIYRFTVPWIGFFLLPGDMIHVVFSRFDLDAVLECLEMKYDLIKGGLEITAANLRGWGDTFGFWMGGTDTWDAGWTSAEVAAAKQEAGYWHGDDDLADSNDYRSINASRWW